MTNKPQKRRILLLSANPRGTSQLRLDEEMREIREGLRRAKQRKEYEIYTAEAVRYRDIHRAILDYEPNIVHFSGHGAGEEGLVFEDETGQTKLVDAEALAGLFELFADQVECVVLNACYSKVQAQAIALHINYVIGMNQAIGDRAAIEFAVGFYDALGAGRPVEFAYRLGCSVIRMAGIPENLTPQLLAKNHAAPRPTVRPKPLSVEPYPSRTVTPYPSPPATPPPKPKQEVKLPTQPPPSQPTASPLAEPEPEEVEEPITKPDEVKLRSERGVDYTKLRNLLAAGEWKEADQETSRVMLQAAGRWESDTRLSLEDIENFPCEDLRTINQLWLHYSDRKFGFSVQKEIYESLSLGGTSLGTYFDVVESLGGTSLARCGSLDWDFVEVVWEKYGVAVGWRKKGWLGVVGGRWLTYDELTFNWELSPEAHLPVCMWELTSRQRHTYSFVDLLEGLRVDLLFFFFAQRLRTCSI